MRKNARFVNAFSADAVQKCQKPTRIEYPSHFLKMRSQCKYCISISKKVSISIAKFSVKKQCQGQSCYIYKHEVLIKEKKQARVERKYIMQVARLWAWQSDT